MKYLFFLIFLSTFLFSCKQASHKHEDGHGHKHSEQHEEKHDDGHHHDHNKSNHLMNKQSFEDLVNAFDSEDRADYQKPEAVLDVLGDLKGKTVLDIGSGTGYFAFRMVERGATVIAADVDQRFLDHIKKKSEEKGIDASKLITKKVPYDSPELKEETLDAVIIVNTYHHIEDRGNYFEQVLNGLKKEGQLLVVDFKKMETPHGPPANHRIAIKEVVSELEQLGNVEIEQFEDLLEEQYLVRLTKY